MPLMPSPALLSPYINIYGGALAFQYTFDTQSQAASDPGVGLFRANDPSFGSANVFYLSSTDGNAQNVGSLISSVLGAAVGVGIRPTGVLCHMIVRSISNPSAWAMYLVTGWSTSGGFITVNVKKFTSLVAPPGTAKDVIISFVLGGMPGGPVWALDASSVDTTTAPPQYKFRMNSAILATVTQIGIDGNTTNMGDWTSVWQSLNVTTGPVIARLIVVNQSTVYRGSGTVKFGYYEVSGFVDQSTWQQINVSYVDSTGTGGPTDTMGATNDPILFAFQWVGVGAKLQPVAPVTGSTSAVANQLIPVDTTSAAVTITLPTAPQDGCPITVKCIARPGSNNVTVAAGGSDVFNKAGGPTTLTLNAVNQGVQLQYDKGDAIWYVVGTITT